MNNSVKHWVELNVKITVKINQTSQYSLQCALGIFNMFYDSCLSHFSMNFDPIILIVVQLRSLDGMTSVYTIQCTRIQLKFPIVIDFDLSSYINLMCMDIVANIILYYFW